MATTIAVSGALAQRPRRGGHAWVFLTWLLGLRRLGCSVVFVDRLEPAWVDGPIESSSEARWLAHVMGEFDLAGDWSLLHDEGRRTLGLSRAALADRLDDAALLVNVMGYLEDPDLRARPARRAYLDIDPGWSQMWHELGLHDGLAGHDAYVTVGGNVGGDHCLVPTCGREWITTAPPVLLDAWRTTAPAGGEDAFTTVATWRGPNAPLEYAGERYGLRAHAFRPLADLPRTTDAPFRIALDIDPADTADRALLEDNAWQLEDPLAVAGDPDAYRDFVQRSGAELMVAKDLYARTRSGWLSDRSAAYLASGRPVLAQDTGFAPAPDGGLLTFSTPAQARAGVAEILRDPAGHAAAARALAQERFDSDRVLGELLDRLEVA
jgi:hypothetical protein